MGDLQREVEFLKFLQQDIQIHPELDSPTIHNNSENKSMMPKPKSEEPRKVKWRDTGQVFGDIRKLAVLAKERDSLHVLWKSSQKTIEALEAELKTYQSCKTHRIEPAQRAEIKGLQLHLETAMKDYIELNNKFKELEKTKQTLENELINRDKEISTRKEREQKMEAELKKVTEQLDTLKINLSSEKQNNELLKTQVEKYQTEIMALAKGEIEAKAKVSEALELYDLVSIQKNEALQSKEAIKRELESTKKKLEKAKDAAIEDFKKDLEIMKEKYNEKVADMLQHIRNLDAELVENRTLLNRALRENKCLQAALNEMEGQTLNMKKSINPQLVLAEQRTEAMFQELLATEKRNVTLVCERHNLSIELTRCRDEHARELKRRDWEEQLLKTQCEEYKMQIDHLQISLKETHEMVNKLQAMLTSRSQLSEKMLAAKEEQTKELSKHLNNQMELNKKWKESYMDMIAKLKKRVRVLKNNNEHLRNIPDTPFSTTDKSSYSENEKVKIVRKPRMPRPHCQSTSDKSSRKESESK